MKVFVHNSYRNLLPEIINLNPGQRLEDFIKFFSKDEVFSSLLVGENKEEIDKYILELKIFFGVNKKVIVFDINQLIQEWNEVIYLIKIEKSLQNYFYKLIKFSIIAKKFNYEKIGEIDYAIDELFYVYELKNVGQIFLISNNSLLLKNEMQIQNYINEALDEVRSMYANKKEKKRRSIPKKVKDELWIKYFGEKEAQGKCYVCSDPIRNTNFEAGHVISHANGGDDIIENLRTVCSYCNKCMGDENLYNYKKRYYPNN
jgi:hypothetical protein